MNEEDRLLATVRWVANILIGVVWFVMLSNKLDKIIHLLEVGR